MKVSIDDEAVLTTLTPQAVTAYAQSAGWNYLEEFADFGSVYGRGGEEIIVPNAEGARDYARAMAAVLSRLAEVERRSALEIFREILRADHDTVRFAVLEGASDASFPLERGRTIVAAAADIVRSAALAAHGPQVAFGAGLTPDVVALHLSRCRVQLGELGRFSLAITSPVAPDLSGDPASEPPFARRAVHQLARALTAVRAALPTASREGSVEALAAAFEDGVSAELCEALGRLSQDASGIEIAIAWARTRPSELSRVLVQFSEADGRVLREAGAQLAAR